MRVGTFCPVLSCVSPGGQVVLLIFVVKELWVTFCLLWRKEIDGGTATQTYSHISTALLWARLEIPSAVSSSAQSLNNTQSIMTEMEWPNS